MSSPQHSTPCYSRHGMSLRQSPLISQSPLSISTSPLSHSPVLMEELASARILKPTSDNVRLVFGGRPTAFPWLL